MSQCTFWCSVLSDLAGAPSERRFSLSQCTFWCSVLSDARALEQYYDKKRVSMHLLVLSAFRPKLVDIREERKVSMHLLVLSAFRRVHGAVVRITRSLSLNAPSGAQCFPTIASHHSSSNLQLVSMHLLVLSAFRP